jgi:hypothetical protein
MKKLLALLGVIIMGMGVCLSATAQEPPSSAVLGLLRSAGATAYAANPDYGAGIQGMYIGYDDNGDPVIGIAERSTKTYKKVLTVVAVVPDGDSYKISAAEVPDMDILPKTPQGYVNDALKDITGKTFNDAASARKLVDGVTGATKYYKAIYVSYSLMASKVIGELAQPPDWPRQPVPAI